MQKGGPYLAIYLWGFMFVLSIVMMTVYPILIAPLFNKFTPVSNADFCHYPNKSNHSYVMFCLMIFVSLAMLQQIAPRRGPQAQN